ncbi:MAG: hypothetical protein E5Y51_10585 [Mesorhizobium sp.]|nr:MAG: hypothetical protein E5Y51_10585 [Mesorhizobium sp.]
MKPIEPSSAASAIASAKREQKEQNRVTRGRYDRNEQEQLDFNASNQNGLSANAKDRLLAGKMLLQKFYKT